MAGKKEDCIDKKFLIDNPRLEKIFIECGIRTYGQIIDLGCKGISLKRGIGENNTALIHNHLKKAGFNGGLPGYGKRQKYYN